MQTRSLKDAPCPACAALHKDDKEQHERQFSRRQDGVNSQVHWWVSRGHHAAALVRDRPRRAALTESFLLELQRRHGNRYVRQLLAVGHRETDDTGEPAAQADDRYLYAVNGSTTCSFPGGTPTVTINNTSCSATCTRRHENVHAADIRSCCTKAGTAYRAATTDAQRTSVENRFYGWLSANRAWFECRAYAESVRCADEEMRDRSCSSPAPADRACCATLSSYRTDKEARRVSNCAAAASSLTACPFP